MDRLVIDTGSWAGGKSGGGAVLSRWQVGFKEPELFFDFARCRGENIRGVGIA